MRLPLGNGTCTRGTEAHESIRGLVQQEPSSRLEAGQHSHTLTYTYMYLSSSKLRIGSAIANYMIVNVSRNGNNARPVFAIATKTRRASPWDKPFMADAEECVAT